MHGPNVVLGQGQHGKRGPFTAHELDFKGHPVLIAMDHGSNIALG
jgi:hypothetical protein